ncbi:TPA: hypothetical protein PXL45_000348 [Yersinia enterocolitica]|nr:hypothetical protein [Yersinia enterocolitica]
MSNPIKTAQVTRGVDGTVMQATYLNAAQETLQQLLASELTKQRHPMIAPKQGDMEQLAIELAQAVGSAFTALDCLPGRLSDLHSRAIRTEELSLKLARTVATLLDRITGTSLGGDFADTRPVSSNQIGRTQTAVRRTEDYLNEALHMLDEINKVIDKPFIIKGGVTTAEVAAMMESNRTIGMDGEHPQFITENTTGEVSRHTNERWIALSSDAKANPILALKLIKRGVPYEEAIGTLQVSARHLTNFTKRKMIEVCPYWECLDTEDRNLEAFNYSKAHNDENGYWAGFNAAQSALDKHAEMCIEGNIRTLIARNGMADTE